jgi:hypothetical protein
MTPDRRTSQPHVPRPLRLAAWAGAFVAVLLAGCRSSGRLLGRGGGGDGDQMARNDPLFGTRIPPQNLPIPGKDSYGAREKADPLYGAPASRDGRDEQASKGSGKGSASRGPRFGKEPYRPSAETTNAALAGHLQPDDSEMSIGDRRPVAVPASIRGPVPLTPKDSSDTGGPTLDQIEAELRKYGGQLGRATREGGQYVVRCDVTLDPDQPGLIRSYTGAGVTPTAAARQVLDQVRGDRAGR